MDDAAAMRCVESRCNFDSDSKSIGNWERAALQPRRERLALEKLHHEEIGAVVMTDIVQRADVRVIQRRNGPRLANEALRRRLAGPGVRSEHLDGDRSLQPCVAGPVDIPHPPGTDSRLEEVRA